MQRPHGGDPPLRLVLVLPLHQQDGRARGHCTSAGLVGLRVGLRKLPVPHILNHMVQYSSSLDDAFAAVSDPTRRGILEQLGHGSATITGLADRFGMTLTGIKK